MDNRSLIKSGVLLSIWLVIILGIRGIYQNVILNKSNSLYSDIKKAFCLQDPMCMLNKPCPMKLELPGWTVCMAHINVDDCLVYSFGIADDWSFDTEMGKLGCEVHSFDPTVNLPKFLDENVIFHKIGLYNGLNTSTTLAFNHSTYGKITGQMMTLQQIRSLLGHENRKINILKIDCEGCEWDVFGTKADTTTTTTTTHNNNKNIHSENTHNIQHIYQNSFNDYDQVLIEFHFTKTLGVNNNNIINKIANTYDNLMSYSNSRTSKLSRFYHRMNRGFPEDRELLPILLENNFPKDICCHEMSFYRIPIL